MPNKADGSAGDAYWDRRLTNKNYVRCYTESGDHQGMQGVWHEFERPQTLLERVRLNARHYGAVTGKAISSRAVKVGKVDLPRIANAVSRRASSVARVIGRAANQAGQKIDDAPVKKSKPDGELRDWVKLYASYHPDTFMQYEAQDIDCALYVWHMCNPAGSHVSMYQASANFESLLNAFA